MAGAQAEEKAVVHLLTLLLSRACREQSCQRLDIADILWSLCFLLSVNSRVLSAASESRVVSSSTRETASTAFTEMLQIVCAGLYQYLFVARY